MAPPITVDIMVFLLDRSRCGRARAHQAASQPENIAQRSVQQGDASQPERKQVRFAEDLSLRSLAPIPSQRETEEEAPMVEVPITIACGNYDRTRAIRDGRVKVEGCEATYLPLYPEEIFFRAFRYQEFDVSELSFSSYIRTVATGNSAYVGIPAFVSRLFRHSG